MDQVHPHLDQWNPQVNRKASAFGRFTSDVERRSKRERARPRAKLDELMSMNFKRWQDSYWYHHQL